MPNTLDRIRGSCCYGQHLVLPSITILAEHYARGQREALQAEPVITVLLHCGHATACPGPRCCSSSKRHISITYAWPYRYPWIAVAILIIATESR